MDCIDCRYSLLKDGHYNCTYEEGECIKINVLEKENAELKEQCSILADCNSCTSTCKTENVEMKKQLNKAKEILRDLYFIIQSRIYYENNTEITDAMRRAEQFLKEV